MFSHLHRGSLELCQSDYWVLGHHPDQSTSPLIAKFGQEASSSKSLGGSKLLPFMNVGAPFFLGPLREQKVLGPLPRICASTQSYLGALQTIPSTPWLGFCSDMHCQLQDLI